MKLQNKKVANFFTNLHLLFLIVTIIIFVARAIDLNNFSQLVPSYSISGIMAALLFVVALVPGSLQRFGLLKQIYSPLIYYRRQIGQFMYVFGIFHLTMNLASHPLFNPTLNFDQGQFYVFIGSVSMGILAPVWITSNNYSLKLLKKHWKSVQRLSYLALITIAIHLFLVESYILALVLFLVLLLIISSWIYKLFLKEKFFKS